jgi:hypothetical protein
MWMWMGERGLGSTTICYLLGVNGIRGQIRGKFASFTHLPLHTNRLMDMLEQTCKAKKRMHTEK